MLQDPVLFVHLFSSHVPLSFLHRSVVQELTFIAPPFTRERAEAERMLSSRIAEIIRFFIVMIFV